MCLPSHELICHAAVTGDNAELIAFLSSVKKGVSWGKIFERFTGGKLQDCGSTCAFLYKIKSFFFQNTG